MIIDGIKPKNTSTDLQSNTAATPIRAASYFTDGLKKSIFDDTTALKSLRLNEDQSSKNNKEIGNNKDTEDNIGNNKDTEDNKEIERLEAKIKLEAKPFIEAITFCIKKINELEKYITNKNPNEEVNEELISSLKKLVFNRVQEFTGENLLSLALSISYKRDKELKTVLYKVWKIYMELTPTPVKMGQGKAIKNQVDQDQIDTAPAVMPDLFSGGRVKTRPNTPRPTQPSMPASLDTGFSLQSNKINKNDLERIMPAGISNTDADKYVALINSMIALMDRIYSDQTTLSRVKELAKSIGLDKLRSSFDTATAIYQRGFYENNLSIEYPALPLRDNIKSNPAPSKLYLICTALDRASRMMGYKDPVITTVTQVRAANAVAPTSPMSLGLMDTSISLFPSIQPRTREANNEQEGERSNGSEVNNGQEIGNDREQEKSIESKKSKRWLGIPVDKITAWRPLAKIETMMRVANLTQIKRRFFNSSRWRGPLLASLLVSSAALIAYKSDTLNRRDDNTNTSAKSPDDVPTPDVSGILASGDNISDPNYLTKNVLAAAEALKELEYTTAVGDDNIVAMPAHPKLDENYEISFESKRQLSVPRGSNVWRVVELNLKEQISNFKDLSNKDRDTLIANIIKAISAQHSNMNLSMIKVGQSFNMPIIKLK